MAKMDAVRKNRLFQHSTMAALVGGLFSGTTSFKELLQHGDLGIGTLDQFDGELIILDGEAFQIRSDGQAYKVKPEDTTPYASTTFLMPILLFLSPNRHQNKQWKKKSQN